MNNTARVAPWIDTDIGRGTRVGSRGDRQSQDGLREKVMGTPSTNTSTMQICTALLATGARSCLGIIVHEIESAEMSDEDGNHNDDDYTRSIDVKNLTEKCTWN